MLWEKLDKGKSGKRTFRYLDRGIDIDLGNQVKKLKIKGLYLASVDRRFYALGENAAHVVGLEGIDNTGQQGIELVFDNVIKGGANEFQLSIDKRIQNYAYRVLRLFSVDNRTKSSSVIVADSRSGQILALANYPSFDPNDRSNLSIPNLWNTAISTQFEPGELTAPFTLLSASNHPSLWDSMKIDTKPGYLRVDGFKIQDAYNYGVIKFRDVLNDYSKVGLSKVALSVPQKELSDIFYSVGFGSITGIEIPGESPGYLSSPGNWSVLEHATIAFGYGLQVTPIQVANAYMSIANDARMTKLTLIKDTKPNWKNLPLVTASDAKKLRYLLQRDHKNKNNGNSLQETKVSGKRALIQKSYAGKYVERYTGVFIGMAPIEKPELLILVLIDEPQKDQYSAGRIAEDIFNEISTFSLKIVRDY